MSEPHRRGPAGSADVRLRGFADRVSFAQATGWLDQHARPLPEETVESARAAGRVLATGILLAHDVPRFDRAVADGYALRARETAGANDYNPLSFALEPHGSILSPGAAALVASGSALPAGADAVLPFEAAQHAGATLRIFGALAPGSGVERQGQQARTGAQVFERGRMLRAQDLGVLATLDLAHVPVLRRPRVKLIIAGPKPSTQGAMQDADGPVLRALVCRDGGAVEEIVMASARPGLAEAMARVSEVDLVLVAGRTGTGPDDDAPLALADAGDLVIHGIALRPGGSAGLGLVSGVPVVLLPGDPMACLCAYELLAGRLLRQMAGRGPDLPHAVREVEVGRKIVSEIGSVDVCQIRLVEGRAEPVGTADFAGVMAAVRADGFVVVPAPLEGYAPGSRIELRLYAEQCAPSGRWS